MYRKAKHAKFSLFNNTDEKSVVDNFNRNGLYLDHSLFRNQTASDSAIWLKTEGFLEGVLGERGRGIMLWKKNIAACYL